MSNINVYEISCKIYLLSEIDKKYAKSEFAFLIDQCLLTNEDMAKLHNTNKSKYYSFSTQVIPNEYTNSLKKSMIYEFKIRTVDEGLLEFLVANLPHISSYKIKVLECDYRVLNEGIIEKIYSITPAVLNFKNQDNKTDGYWEKNHSLEDVLNRIQQSLIIQYNKFANEEIPLDTVIFNSINKRNNYPISEAYVKNEEITFLCDKFELYVEMSLEAQKIAQFACATGIGSRCARGFGFVNPKRLNITKRGATKC